METRHGRNSFFDGGLLSFIGWHLLGTIFTGSAFGLFGNWIKWLLLTIITLGIYGFWVGIKIRDWKARNTIFIN